MANATQSGNKEKMAFLLGVDTGGTYTDAVVLDDSTDQVIASAKALTSRPDLSKGITGAIDAALADAKVTPDQIALVSLSTTLATNALVEGQGGRVAFVAIGFDAADMGRAGLTEALGADPVISLAGGHDHAGQEKGALDLAALETGLSKLDDGVTGFAVAGAFAARNPAHEIAARDFIRMVTGKPVTCGHELSSALGGPKRALTAVLNARLIGLVDGLITACEAYLTNRTIAAPLMVVRGDGALVSAAIARQKPIETILSGPAASVAGASWLTDAKNAMISDIGGTTTDICLFKDGKPMIDPQGAQVGPFRTMVEAVAMRTSGLGGDSEVHVKEGLASALFLGPRRLMPIALAARDYPDVVHDTLDQALAQDLPPADGGQFAVPLWSSMPTTHDAREAAVLERLSDGPQRLSHAAPSRLETAALGRLVSRGLVVVAGVTPSDASHVLGRSDAWDADAATKALTLMARRKNGAGQRFADSPQDVARMIIGQLTMQTVDCVMQAAFTEDGWDAPETLTAHRLTQAGLDGHRGLVQMQVNLGVPLIGLGASAHSYYGAVGERLGCQVILPPHADVANAVGAVVGQVMMRVSGAVTSAGDGAYVAHFKTGPVHFNDAEGAMTALEVALRAEAKEKAAASGVEDPQISVTRDMSEAEIEGQPMFVSANIVVTASGRPRIAVA